MDETADVLLAYKMNGKDLSPDHGYPIRLIVPGYIGGRMVSVFGCFCVCVQRGRERKRMTDGTRWDHG